MSALRAASTALQRAIGAAPAGLCIALCAALLAAAGARADCPPFRELRPARLVRDGTVLWLERGLDPDWYECARKAGGKLRARSEVERSGQWELDANESNVGPHLRVGAWASNYCGRLGKADPTRVRIVVEGQGAMAAASLTTEPLASLCGCAKYLQVELQARPAAAGIAVQGALDPAWLACRREGGGQFEVRAYAGRTEAEALAAVVPAAALRNLEHRATFSGTLPRAALCARGAKVAVVELAGRGPLSMLTGEGRTVVPLDCAAP